MKSLMQICVKQVIDQTEFMGRGLVPKIADDITDRIQRQTGYVFQKGRLYEIYRKQLAENEVDIHEKNALAQFAQYHDWEHFVDAVSKTLEKKPASPFSLFWYILIFLLGIYTLFSFLLKIFL